LFGIWRAFAYDAAPVNDPKRSAFVVAAGTIAACSRRRSMPARFGRGCGKSRGTARSPTCDLVGFRDRAKTVPLQPDAIFWIASMTKPVTAWQP